jgi:uncharacterized membrane protein YdjX (TVP38/TMEM64 family)
MKRQSWLINSLLCIALVVGVVWFNHNVLHLAPEEIRVWILSFGWAAPVLYILIYTIRPLILFQPLSFRWQAVWLLDRFGEPFIRSLAPRLAQCYLLG